MFRKNLQFEVVHAETEHVKLNGGRYRSPTVLIRVGRRSVSRKALFLGGALAICHTLDGVLTCLGVSIHGLQGEGNGLLRSVMVLMGTTPALFIVKSLAIGVALGLTIFAHKRRWVRPVLACLVGFYLSVAIAPWVYVLTMHGPR